jgi:hypothetical protein
MKTHIFEQTWFVTVSTLLFYNNRVKTRSLGMEEADLKERESNEFF